MTDDEKKRALECVNYLLENSAYRKDTEVGVHYLLDPATGYDRYSILSHNCTTLVRDILEYSYQGKHHFTLDSTFVPSELFNRLLRSNDMIISIDIFEPSEQ